MNYYKLSDITNYLIFKQTKEVQYQINFVEECCKSLMKFMLIYFQGGICTGYYIVKYTYKLLPDRSE